MLKKLIVLVLCICIVIGILASAFAIGAQGSDDNWFNVAWRPKLARMKILRGIFNLHNDGDAKSDYLGTKTQNIALILKPSTDQWFSDDVWQNFSKKITTATGKPVKITRDSYAPTAIEAPLYVYLEDINEENSLTLGKTHNENGIILYEQGLEEFSEFAPETKEVYILSTLLHEFGHQIGLVHNEQPGCLMNSRAETGGNAKFLTAQVVTSFCADEIEQILKIKNES